MTYGELKKLLATIPPDQDTKSVWIYIGEYPYYIQIDPEHLLMLKDEEADPYDYYEFEYPQRADKFNRPFEGVTHDLS